MTDASPVEALQQEIALITDYINRCDDSGVSFNQWSYDVAKRHLAALELAKADADMCKWLSAAISHQPPKRKLGDLDEALQSARAKLYEALQR